MLTVIQTTGSVAVIANAVVYGTDMFGAIVLRPAVAAVDDRTLTQMLGHIHRLADRRFPPIGAVGFFASVATTALAAATGRWVSTVAGAVAVVAPVSFPVIYNRVSAPVNAALTTAATAARVRHDARQLQARWDSVIDRRVALQAIALVGPLRHGRGGLNGAGPWRPVGFERTRTSRSHGRSVRQPPRANAICVKGVSHIERSNMHYALLIHEPADAQEGMSSEQAEALSAEYLAIRADQRITDGAHLQPALTATTLRERDGQLIISDGPFAETKEVFAGYFILEADHLDHALDIARRIPAVRLGGSVEIRPLAELPV